MILVIGGGPMQVPIIRAAKQHDKVLVFDMDPYCVGRQLADDFAQVSTRNYHRAVRVAKAMDYEYKAVVSGGTDCTETVTAVALHNGCRCHSWRNAMILTRKELMCEHLRDLMPENTSVIDGGFDPSGALYLGGDRVVKPADNMGARGVTIVPDGADVTPAIQEAKACSPSGVAIVQKLVGEVRGPATEISAEYFVKDGIPYLISMAERMIVHRDKTRWSDRVKRKGYLCSVELGHRLPVVTLNREELKYCDRACQTAMGRLGILWGPVKFDLAYWEGRPWIIEVCGRLSGGWHSTHTGPEWSGLNYVEEYVKEAVSGTGSFDHALLGSEGQRQVYERCLTRHPRGGYPGVFIERENYRACMPWFNAHGKPEVAECNAEKMGSLIVSAAHGENIVDVWNDAEKAITT